MADQKEPTSSSTLAFIEKVGNYLIGGTLLCYMAGFAITNLYLGSMGVVNFDILRARYILAGLLFLFFVGAIIYLVYGFLKTAWKHDGEPFLNTIMGILKFSFYNLVTLYVALAAISVFAGSTHKSLYQIPHSTSFRFPLLNWFNQASLNALKGLGILMVLILAAIALTIFIALVVLIINPKNQNGTRTPRKQIVTDLLKSIWPIKVSTIRRWIGGLIALYAFTMLASLLASLIAGEVSTAGLVPSMQGGWMNFFIAVILASAIIVAFIISVHLYPFGRAASKDNVALPMVSGSIYFVAIGIALVVPAYAFYVYPGLPQQVGGGQLLVVEVSFSDDELGSQFGDPGTETYLVDRTSSSLILMLVDEKGSEPKIMEVSTDLVQSITYAKTP